MSPLLNTAKGARLGESPVYRIYQGTKLITTAVTNDAVNPSFEDSTTGWLSDGLALSYVSADGWSGPGFASATLFNRSMYTVAYRAYHQDVEHRAGPMAYTMSAYVRGRAGTLAAVGAETITMSNGAVRYDMGGFVTLSPTWQRITRTSSWDAANSGGHPQIWLDGLPDDVIDIDAVMFSFGSNSISSYRDGSFPGWKWEGVPNASPSFGWA